VSGKRSTARAAVAAAVVAVAAVGEGRDGRSIVRLAGGEWAGLTMFDPGAPETRPLGACPPSGNGALHRGVGVWRVTEGGVNRIGACPPDAAA
jgi:hypothetical protein